MKYGSRTKSLGTNSWGTNHGFGQSNCPSANGLGRARSEPGGGYIGELDVKLDLLSSSHFNNIIVKQHDLYKQGGDSALHCCQHILHVYSPNKC
jgi:hypothetical protein